jgi:DNA polymerase V
LIALNEIFINGYRYQKARITLTGLVSARVNKSWNIRKNHSSKIDTDDFHSLLMIKAI